MTRRLPGLCCLVLVLATLGVNAAGCAWVGRTAGKTQAKVEKQIDAAKDGYQEAKQEYREAYEAEHAQNPSGGRNE